MNLLEEIKKRVAESIPVQIYYYGPSTTSFEYVFPNWGEILRYVLKTEMEKYFTDYNQINWNLFTHNMGLDGALSKDLLDRFPSLVLRNNPDIIFLHTGKNDLHFGVSTEVTKGNTVKMIDAALKQSVFVVFATSIPSLKEETNLRYQPYLEVEKQVGEMFKENPNFIFVNMFDGFSKEDIKKSYTFIEEIRNDSLDLNPGDVDYIHYNLYGNAKVAEILLKETTKVDFSTDKFLKSIKDETIKYPKY